MDLQDFELVDALARTGSVTAAAAELHTAQPALSRRLQRLEREVGAPLFLRGRHGAVPTVVGEVLVERAVEVLDAVARARREVGDAAAGRSGRLRIGTAPTLGADLLPPVLAALRVDHPGVLLDLVTSGDSDWLQAEVRDGRLDTAIAVVIGPLPSGTRCAASGPQPFVVVAPADHRFADVEHVPRRDLVGEPVVALRRGEGLRLLIDRTWAELGAVPDIAIEAAERELLIPFVTAGLGITVVPEVFSRQRAGAGVVVRPLRPAIERTVGVVVRTGPVPPLVGHLVAAVAAVL